MMPWRRSGLPDTRTRAALVLALAAASLLGGATAAAGVTVTPSALYIDHRTRSGALTLYNGGLTAEEIEITFAFGYARSDEHGYVQVFFFDSVPPDEPTAVPFLRAFPRRLRLEPGQRQLVRILVQPPSDLADGEYWARVMVAAKGGQPPIEQRSGDVMLQLEVKTVFAIALNYRHGTVSTGVVVADARAEASERSADLLLDMERHGNAAFLGHVRAELIDPSGKVVGESDLDVAVYHRILWRIRIPLPEGIAAGPGWSVRYRLSAEREDHTGGEILPALSQGGTVPVRAPSSSP